MMNLPRIVIAAALLLVGIMTQTQTNAFVVQPVSTTNNRPTQQQQPRISSLYMAKYNTMNEILELFPKDKPILINFYDSKTENDIKNDIQRAKTLLADRATIVSIKQQDYPEIAKTWDADKKSPSMILFRDGQPVARLFEETHYLEIVAKVGKFCQ